MKTEEIIIKTESYYSIQGLRIQAQLRIKAFVRDKRLTKEEAKKLHHWNDDMLKNMEQGIKKEMETIISDIPIYEKFFKKIKGIGPCLAGSLYAGIYDISRFSTISKLWTYCGMNVVCDKCQGILKTTPDGIVCAKCGEEASGEAPRRIKGKKITWNPFLRMTLHKISDSFIKQNAEKSQYRRLYDEFKFDYQTKFPQWEICWHCKGKMVTNKTGIGMKCVDCEKDQAGIPHKTRLTKDKKPIFIYTKNHIHNMAKRKVSKIFLQHLFVRWWELDHNTTPTKPWILTHGEHTTYIECEEA